MIMPEVLFSYNIEQLILDLNSKKVQIIFQTEKTSLHVNTSTNKLQKMPTRNDFSNPCVNTAVTSFLAQTK